MWIDCFMSSLQPYLASKVVILISKTYKRKRLTRPLLSSSLVDGNKFSTYPFLPTLLLLFIYNFSNLSAYCWHPIWFIHLSHVIFCLNFFFFFSPKEHRIFVLFNRKYSMPAYYMGPYCIETRCNTVHWKKKKKIGIRTILLFRLTRLACLAPKLLFFIFISIRACMLK